MARLECDTPVVLHMMGAHNYFFEKVVSSLVFVGLVAWDWVHI